MDEITDCTQFHSCGCLINSRGAHRKSCPDFETVYVGDARTSNRLDDMRWVPREGR